MKVVLLNLIRKNKYKACISPLTVATTWYLTSTSRGEQEAKSIVKKLIKGIIVEDLTHEIIDESFNLDQKDFEDSIQFLTALKAKCSHIITRDKKEQNIKEWVKVKGTCPACLKKLQKFL